MAVVAVFELATRGHFWIAWWAAFPSSIFAYIVLAVLILIGWDPTTDAPAWQTVIGHSATGVALVVAAFVQMLLLERALTGLSERLRAKCSGKGMSGRPP